MNEDILEIMEIALRINKSGDAIVFIRFSGHVNLLSISICSSLNYENKHPKWNRGNKFGDSEFYLDLENQDSIKAFLARLVNFEKNCKITESEILEKEMLSVLG